VSQLAGGSEGARRRSYQASVDRESQSLVVAATPQVHAQVADLVRQLDVPVAAAQSPVRFYKLKNTKAADVLATVGGLLADAGGGSRSTGGRRRRRAGAAIDRRPGDAAGGPLRSSADRGATGIPGAPAGDASADARGIGASGTAGVGTGGFGTAGFGSGASRGRRPFGGCRATHSSTAGTAAGTAGQASTGSAAPGSVHGAGAGRGGSGVTAFRGRDATVAADVNTNSIVVIAPPDVQRLYADLIARLDVRRPQVQVECTIVTLDTSDGASFGVDIGRLGGFDGSRVISFSSFGVSGVDPLTGRLTPTGGRGGTFALLSPNIADVVLRALATNTRSRLVSAPQLLVNDNGKGTLASVAVEPFAELLDTGTNQTRTALGGQASAGTSITVEPNISEGDYLQLAYSVELSSFTGTGGGGLPPPSQKNTIQSAVTIPDGHTIVVGGLSVRNLRAAVDSLPLIGGIPVLEYLFGTRTRSSTDTTLFVFIRPVILRDDKFEDLKYLSGRTARAAGLPPDVPTSEPVPAR
jgi:general secretion pathway protein D